MTICKNVQTIIFSIFLLFAASSVVHASEATFSWEANTEPTLSGYKIHYGTSSRDYSSVIDVGLPAVVDGWVVHSVDGLLAGTTYYFAATAYSATEVSGYSDEVVYTVPGTAAPEPPVVNNIALQGSEDTLLAGQLEASNPDGAALSFTVVSQPDHGLVTLEEDTGFFTYSPAANYSGNDAFSYTAANSGGTSNTATVSLTIVAVNVRPAADSASIAVDANSSYAGQLLASDGDGDTLNFAMVTAPAKGSLSIAANGTFTYIPSPHVTGLDSFTFTASDGSLESNTARVDIIINELPADDAPTNEFAFEVGELQVTSDWQSVSFDTAFVNPALVAKAATMNDAEPGTVRIRNLTSTGFEIRFQEWDYLDGVHPAETITFMAMEQGQHQMADNMQAIAGCSDVSDLYNFHQIYFTQPLPTTPVVLASIVTENEQDAVTLRMKDIGADGFALALQEQESNYGTHTTETACFIAIEEGSGMVDNLMIEVAATEKILTDTATTIPFAQLFPVRPFTLADMQSANGGDTAVLGINNLSAAEAGLAIVEETSADSEVRHIAETGGYVAIAPYDAVPPPLSLSFELGEITVDSVPVRVNFTSPFSQPVIIANTITRNDTAPSVIRISDVDAEGFTIQIQAYDYLATDHGMETISYLVMEKGNYSLDDGTRIEAGLFDTNATNFAAQPLEHQLDVTPVIFTSIITMNGSEAVIGRVRNISSTGFEYKLQEQEANKKIHWQETVAYLAWTPGSGTTNGIHFQVGNTEDAVTHNAFAINFNENFAASPFHFAGMQTTDGGDTALVKIIQAGAAGMEIMVEEESSRDAETNHTKEIAGFLVLLPE